MVNRYKTPRKTQKEQEQTRIEIVKFLNEGKGTQKTAAKLFGVSESAVSNIRNRFLKKGWEGLHNAKRGVKEGKKIKNKMARKILSTIVNSPPEKQNLPGLLWSRKVIQGFIDKKAKTELSRWQVDRYLKSWGIEPVLFDLLRKASLLGPSFRNWYENEYPEMKKKANQSGGKVFWIEKGNLKLNWPEPSKKSKSKSKNGFYPFEVTVLFAIDNRGFCKFLVNEGKLKDDSEPFEVGFVKRLFHEESKKIFLICEEYSDMENQRFNIYKEMSKKQVEHSSFPYIGTHVIKEKRDESIRSD